MDTKRIAIICANGIGDGLIMMTAAAHLQMQSDIVTIFHEKSAIISILFPITYRWDTYNTAKIIHFDLIIIQYDGNRIVREILDLRLQKNFPRVIVFFPYKHPKMQKTDLLFNRSMTMVDNIILFMQQRFPHTNYPPAFKNDMLIPKGEYRKHPHRIIIHPSSANSCKNWTPIQFVILAKKLRSFGYCPVFIVSPKEKTLWKSFLSCTLPVQSFANLSDVSSYLYESGYFIGNDSGLGHLASNLQIPTLTIFSKKSLSPLWNPGFGIHKVLLPYRFPNFKGLSICIREWLWPISISTRKVTKEFFLLMQKT